MDHPASIFVQRQYLFSRCEQPQCACVYYPYSKSQPPWELLGKCYSLHIKASSVVNCFGKNKEKEERPGYYIGGALSDSHRVCRSLSHGLNSSNQNGEPYLLGIYLVLVEDDSCQHTPDTLCSSNPWPGEKPNLT